MINDNVINFFLRQAEIGNWNSISVELVEKKFNIKNKKIYKAIPEKKYFLSCYSKIIDEKVLKNISKEDFELSSIDEILQEFLMNKLELMNNHKFAISNIVNFYITSPKSLLINLKSSKKSIECYLEMFDYSGNIVKKKLLIKLILSVWLLAFQKWLYEDDDNSKSYSIIDKGLKKIKNNTKLFDLIKKKENAN